MFDFIVVDLSSELNPVANALLQIAERILLVSSQTLSSVKRTLDIIRLMGEAGFPEEKILLTLNKVVPDLEKAKLVVPLQTIEQKAKRKPLSLIPQDERRVLAALRTGLPVVAKDQSQSPAKELLMLADAVRANLLPPEEAEAQATQKADASKSKLGRLFSG
jgi:Flp pilus assembly CpaE family ATPase